MFSQQLEGWSQDLSAVHVVSFDVSFDNIKAIITYLSVNHST